MKERFASTHSSSPERAIPSIGLLACAVLGGAIAPLSTATIWTLAAEQGPTVISAVLTGVGLSQVVGIVLGILQGDVRPRTLLGAFRWLARL